MASLPSNANHPRIPGRCDICDMKDGKRNMNFVQCSKCKVCVHRECYMVFPQDDAKDFVCFACAAVGRTFQAVETHMSQEFFEIQQTERPKECALCSVSDGVHAMYPLFDYHGKGGRQICVPAKKSSSHKRKKGEKVLVWAHALCALYLASRGYMYACFKNGDYLGIEEDENDTDPRPPNPELKITREFRKRYGDAMPYFRYYLTPPHGAQDMYTQSVNEQKRDLKCIECGLKDDDHKSLRIPLQCVANDADEFSEHRKKHRERNNDVRPCTQALHVGCARWGDPSSTVRKCYFFPGMVNQDGSIAGNLDTVGCLYCKQHAENVDDSSSNHSSHQKKRKAALDKEQLDHILQQRIRAAKISQKAGASAKDRLAAHSNKPSKQPLTVPPSPTNRKRTLSMTQNSKPLDEKASAKRRRKNANDRSIGGKEEENNNTTTMIQIFQDLVHHGEEIAQNRKPTLKARKRYWKQELSGFSIMEFDSIWMEAKRRFSEDQKNRKANLDNSSRKSSTHPSGDAPDGERIVEAEKPPARNSSDEDSAMEVDFSVNASTKNVTEERSKGGNAATRKRSDSIQKSETQQTAERPPDRWSRLFIGMPFQMGNQFTLDKSKWKIR